MKRIILYTSTFVLLIFACKAEPVNKELTNMTHARAREIIGFAKENKTDELIKTIRPAKESGIKRHAATVEKVKRLFGDIELSKIEFGPSSYEKVRNVIIVQIIAPIRIDLEFSIDPGSGKPAKLQALHP